MTHVVILGAGIAGVPLAYALRDQLTMNDVVTVVSDKDYFHFVPSNPWVALGWRAQQDIAFPIEPYLSRRDINFVHKTVTGIDPKNNIVEADKESKLHYDVLVIATGAQPASDEFDGLAAHTHSVIHLEQAIDTYKAYKTFLKKPGPIVIGATQNASILGPVYELAFLVDADLRQRNIRGRVPITIVTPEPYAGHLGIGDEKIRRLLEPALAQRDIKCLTKIKTLKAEAGKMRLMQCDAAGKDQQAIDLPFSFSVYWPAFRGITALRDNKELSDKRGFVLVNEYLQHPLHANIYAIGICAAQAPVEKTPLPIGAPESVYSIQQNIKTVVKNILALRENKPMESAVPFRSNWLTDMGETGAAYLSAPQIPLRNINWLKQGQWVYEAKVEFEKYFINKLKLLPVKGGTGLQSHLASVASQLQTETTERPRPIAFAADSKNFAMPVPRDTLYILQALAKTLGHDEKAIAALILSAAVEDIQTLLSPDLREAIERARREFLLSELPENQPGVQFEGGAP